MTTHVCPTYNIVKIYEHVSKQGKRFYLVSAAQLELMAFRVLRKHRSSQPLSGTFSVKGVARPVLLVTQWWMALILVHASYITTNR